MFSKKQISLGLIYIGLSVLTASSVSAQPSDDGQQSGGTSGGPGPKSFRRGGGGPGMGHHMRFPKEEDVLNLPGLTAKQKTDIQALYKQEKLDTAPLRKQIRESMGGGANAGAGAATTSGGGKGANMDLVKQMHEARKANWEKVKALLTPAQIAALKPSGPPAGGPGGPPGGGPGGAPAGGPNGPPGEDQ